jgi:hypothetical protein
MVMDYLRQFDRDTLSRLGDAGVREVLALDSWDNIEGDEGWYNLDEYVPYLVAARNAGIKVLYATAGGPSWAPDDWHLKNLQGEYNQARDWLRAERANPTLPGILGFGYVSTSTWLSFWNPEAEAATKKHVSFLRSVTEEEGASLMPWIGGGEYFFPAPCFIPSRPWTDSEWWYDDGAQKSWLRYLDEANNPTRAGWVYQEQARVTKERLSWYSEKWLQLVPYWRQIRFGTENTEGILAENGEGLSTILFTVFANQDGWEDIARAQAALYPTWCGAEGPVGILTNAPKAKAMGMAGVVCGPLWPGYGLQKMEPWVYENIRKVTDD